MDGSGILCEPEAFLNGVNGNEQLRSDGKFYTCLIGELKPKFGSDGATTWNAGPPLELVRRGINLLAS